MNARYAVSLTAASGLAITLLITTAGLTPEYQNRALHVTKETVAALVLLLVAAVLGGRVSRTGSLADLLALAGVLVLATKNLVFSVLTAILAESTGGLATWRTTGAGLIGAMLLAAAALAPRRAVKDRRRAILIAVCSAPAAFVLLSAASAVFEFPGALTHRPETDAELTALSEHTALVVADVGAAAFFLIAGAAFGRRAEREADEFQMWLGISATIAAVGYLNYALFPSSYTDFLYAGDLFRVAAVVAFGIGTVREISKYQAVYAPAAVLEERRRLASDLHDGVAQELAFIASRMHRLAAEGAHEPTVSQVAGAVRRALEESRAAISTLNRPLEEPLHVSLAETAADQIGQAGTRLELDLDPAVVVPPAWEQALPRILREAVSNAVLHGRASTVRVHLRDADGIWLRVADDGRGFDPTAPAHAGSYGLITMRERAESLGGEFRLVSEPGTGTTVEVLLP